MFDKGCRDVKIITLLPTHSLTSGQLYGLSNLPQIFFSITNLKYWGNSEQIISKTLQLLSDLSVGYGTVRKLVKLEEV